MDGEGAPPKRPRVSCLSAIAIPLAVLVRSYYLRYGNESVFEEQFALEETIMSWSQTLDRWFKAQEFSEGVWLFFLRIHFFLFHHHYTLLWTVASQLTISLYIWQRNLEISFPRHRFQLQAKINAQFIIRLDESCYISVNWILLYWIRGHRKALTNKLK